MNKLTLLLMALTISGAAAAADDARSVKTAVFPQTQGMVVAAEGDFEPRSSGSYSLRLYDKADPAFPYDRFIAGIVRPRDGSVEQISFADLDGDGKPEIVVTLRSAGSGSYLSADAFRFRARSLTPIASVSGLNKNADAVDALIAKLQHRSKRAMAPAR
jgi:hypothetical protein